MIPNIHFFEEDVKIPDFNSEFFISWILKTEQHESQNIGTLNFIFKNNENMRSLNIQYLDHNFDTDIITFDYSYDQIISGDIFLNIDFIENYSNQNKISFKKELSRVMIHGVLHLCGYKDHSIPEKKAMRDRENFYLSLQ